MKKNTYFWIVFGVLILTSDSYALFGIKAGFGISSSSYNGIKDNKDLKLVDIKGLQYNGRIMFTGLPFFDFGFSSLYIKSPFTLEFEVPTGGKIEQKFDLLIKAYIVHGNLKLSIPLIPIIPYAGVGVGKYNLDFESEAVRPEFDNLKNYINFADFKTFYGFDAVLGSRFKLMFFPFEPYAEVHYSKIYTPVEYSNIECMYYEIGILLSVF